MSVRIGFVGVGGIAGVHLRCLASIPGAEVAAVCDIDPARAKKAAEQFCKGARVHLNYRSMIDEEDLDAMYICVPPFAHSHAEIWAARAGLSLFVEKPVALTNERAEMIADEIEKAGIISCVGYHWRYYSGVDIAKSQLAERDIAMIHGYYLSGMPGTDWWRVKEKSGGQIVEQTTHVVDLARYFGGDVASVYAAGFSGIMEKRVDNYTVDDASTVVLRFHTKVVANISSTDILPFSHTVGLHIIADGAVVEVSRGGVKIIEQGKTTQIQGVTDAHRTEDEIFIRAVEQNDQSQIRSSYSDAVKSLAVCLAANESIETGKVVEL